MVKQAVGGEAEKQKLKLLPMTGIIKKTAQGVMTMEEKKERKRQTIEDLIRAMQEERERVAKLSLEELEKYIQRSEAIDEFLWPREKHEHPRWLLQLLEEKKKEARAQSNETVESLKTSGRDKKQEN